MGMRVENMIVKGKYFINLEPNRENFHQIKNNLIEFMYKKAYEPEDPKAIFFQDKFFTITFYSQVDTKKIQPSGINEFFRDIQKFLGFYDESKIIHDLSGEHLLSLRNDVPFRVTFYIIPQRTKELEGFLVSVRSEPALSFKKKRIIGFELPSDEFLYSSILDTNKNFMNEVMLGLGASVLEEPRAIAEIVKTPVVEKLENLDFKSIAELLKSGKLKVERGDTEDGLTDLRSALEMFVYQIVEKIGKQPQQQDKIKQNLQILKDEDLLDERMSRLLKEIVCGWLNAYLSDKPVHHREKAKLLDAKFMFDIAEENMNYLLDKVIIRS